MGRLGIPAVQLECPPVVRERLVHDRSLAAMFAEAIAGTYREVVEPWWHEAPVSCPGEPEIPLDAAMGQRLDEIAVEDVPSLAAHLVTGLLDLETKAKEKQ